MSEFFKIDLTGIKGILLDFDNALYKYDPCHKNALDSVYFEIKNYIEVESFDKFHELYKEAQEKVKVNIVDRAASHSRLLYFQRLFECHFGGTKIQLSLYFENLYWEAFFEKMILAVGAIDFLKKCKNQNVKVCIVTDLTAQIQLKKIKYLALEEYIDFVVSSEEAGVEKPSGRIFLLALEKLGMGKEEVLMIGDSKKRDVEGAKNLGIKSHLIKL